jgi:exosortase A
VWERRIELRALTPNVSTQAFWLAPLVLLIWWIGTFAAINEARQLAVVGFAQVAIWAMLGNQVYRRLLFPSLYLFFLVPMGEYLIGPLQTLTTVMTDHSLTVLGVPHFTQGSTIELSTGTFEIAEACAGLRFLIATVALGTLFAYLSYRTWYKSAVFLAACIVVPILGNGLRVLGIILLAHATNNQVGAGADHIVYGWGLNVGILLLLMLAGSRFRDQQPEPQLGAAEPKIENSNLKVLSVLLVTLTMVAAGPATAALRESHLAEANVTALTGSLSIPGLHISPADRDIRPTYIGTDAELAIQLNGLPYSANEPVTLYVEYYKSARAGHSLITHLNREWDGSLWQPIAAQAISTRIADVAVEMRETTLAAPMGSRLVWSTYWVGGHFTPSPLTAKFWQAIGEVLGNDGEAAVVLSTPIESSPEEARARMTAALVRLTDLQKRLSAAGSPPPGR